MTANVSQEHIEIAEGIGGPKARIAGSRIRVEDVAIWEEFRKNYNGPLERKPSQHHLILNDS